MRPTKRHTLNMIYATMNPTLRHRCEKDMLRVALENESPSAIERWGDVCNGRTRMYSTSWSSRTGNSKNPSDSTSNHLVSWWNFPCRLDKSWKTGVWLILFPTESIGLLDSQSHWSPSLQWNLIDAALVCYWAYINKKTHKWKGITGTSNARMVQVGRMVAEPLMAIEHQRRGY